ncbi:MAG: 4-hydroxy-3-methylbut-2-enyl diphosphate reductase [Candidatus Cloacimonetes bacterium 4572_65]|nr:MAG: 4-hydroxy-3-methylbut-2-enyl diphosphate reductase [Candidatus Cloacimonetes bacterium 4572_65]
MLIRLAENSGFCYGVKRAINIAEREAEKRASGLVTIGPIIHNPQVVKRLHDLGVVEVDDVTDGEGKPSIVRSHGLSRKKIKYMNDNNIEVIDATCPYVEKLQMKASLLSNEGYHIIILGDNKHPEVVALTSYIDGDYQVVNSASEVASKYYKKLAVVSQTTQTLEKFRALVSKLLNISYELHIVNTICSATSVRQNGTRKLAKNSDIVIVIGGKMSSNTKMLATISSEYTTTYHIETYKELKNEWFLDVENVGITAGASTPDELIIEVYNKIININGDDETKRFVSEIAVFKEEQNEF